jgi:quercetin dioxygenase-like cupin family protein
MSFPLVNPCFMEISQRCSRPPFRPAGKGEPVHATSGRDDADDAKQAAIQRAAIHPAAGPDGVRIGAQLRAGEYPPIDFGGTGMREYLLTPSGEKRVQVILSDIQPGGGSGDESYSLPADVEFAFVLAGRLHITVAGEGVTLDQGDAYTFPADAPHTFRSAHASGRTQVLWLVSPALPDTGWQRPSPS